MRTIKWMLTGIMLALIGVFFAASDAGRGGDGAAVAFPCLGLGIVVFLIGLILGAFKNDWTKKI